MIQVGDIIEFDSTQHKGIVKHYGYVDSICNETDQVRIRWFDENSLDFCGQYIVIWTYGLMWRKVR